MNHLTASRIIAASASIDPQDANPDFLETNIGNSWLFDATCTLVREGELKIGGKVAVDSTAMLTAIRGEIKRLIEGDDFPLERLILELSCSVHAARNIERVFGKSTSGNLSRIYDLAEQLAADEGHLAEAALICGTLEGYEHE